MQNRIFKIALLLAAVMAAFGAHSGAWAQASSTHIITVERVFSARPRSIGYRYLVQISCRPQGESIVTVPVKRTSFKWEAGTVSGVSETDNNGQAEFTQTAFDGKLEETLKVHYFQRLLLFSAPKGMVELPLPVQCK
ncbi:hypothetical protein ACLVWU_10370 [Bdellovibrio sp. HCB290]|uniref:hypothetical protein n=1 Tax=Bdellovibrio sp. HCB290 TaxID=3394356 RepID=UPI0039B544B9